MLIVFCNKGVEMMEFRRTEDAVGFGSAAMTAWLRDAQAWTGLRCELLSGIDALWAVCAKRQTEAIETSARSLQGFFDGRHLLEMAQLQRDWLASAARRTANAADRWAGDSAARIGATSVVVGSGTEAANDAIPQPSSEREAAE